jgi:hypothetical protein
MTEKIADDAKPMTGVWYRSTSEPRMYGKVTEKTDTEATVTFTGGLVETLTYPQFAAEWELV